MPKEAQMKRTYIDRIAEYYRQKDDEFDLMMGAYVKASEEHPRMEP